MVKSGIQRKIVKGKVTIRGGKKVTSKKKGSSSSGGQVAAETTTVGISITDPRTGKTTTTTRDVKSRTGSRGSIKPTIIPKRELQIIRPTKSQQVFRDAKLEGISKILTEKQRKQVLSSRDVSLLGENLQIAEQLITPEDRKFILVQAKAGRPIARIYNYLSDKRVKAYTQALNQPMANYKRSIEKIKEGNPFTRNWTDRQAEIYARSFLITKPKLIDKYLFGNRLDLSKKAIDLSKPAILLPKLGDLQRSKVLTNQERKTLKQTVKSLPKEFAIGLGLAVKEILIDLPAVAVKGSFNYGKNLVKRAQKDKTKAINKLGGDILKLNKGLFTTRKYIQDNPKEALTIIGLAVGMGLKSLEKSYNKNPGRTLGLAVGYLSGIPERLAAKGLKITGVTRALQEAKFIGKQPKEIRPLVREVIKGAKFQENLTPSQISKLNKINFSEVTELTKIEAKALEQTLKNTDSFVFGSVSTRAISKGRTPIPKDVDLATKNSTAFLAEFKTQLPVKIRAGYKIKGAKLYNPKGVGILDIKAFSKLRPNANIFGKGQLPVFERIYKGGKKILQQAGFTVPTKKLVNIKGIKLVGFGEQTTRKALGTIQVILEKEARRAKDPQAFLIGLRIQLEALKGNLSKSLIKNPFKVYTAKRLEQSLKILESKQFSLLLEKQVPGILKDYPILAKVSKVSKTKAFKTALKNKIKQLKDKFKQRPTTIKKPVKTKTKSKKTSSKIRESKIRKGKSKIPKSRLPKSRVPKSSKVPTSKVPKGSRIPVSRLPKPSIVPKTSTVPKSSIIPESSIIPKGSRVPKGSRIPKGAKTPPPKKPIIPKLKLGFDSSQLKDRVATFSGTYVERRNPAKNYNPRTNPRVTKSYKKTTTKNRLLKFLATKTDRNLSRTISNPKVIGLGKKTKDIKKPKVLKKFKKTKQGYLEKPKAAFDSNREISEAKRLKRKASVTKKVKKKVKVSKKSKKSSQNRSKATRKRK